MAWSSLTAATKSYSNVTRGSVDTWTAQAESVATWTEGTTGASKTYTAQGSNTTARNTSRFVLLSAISYQGGYRNMQPAYRSRDKYGPAFIWTSTDPIQFHGSGESTV